jgi:hypothetical protein
MEKPLRVGDWVLVRFPYEETGKNRKLFQPWHGPYRVLYYREPDVIVVKVYFPQETQIQVHQTRPCNSMSTWYPSWLLLVWTQETQSWKTSPMAWHCEWPCRRWWVQWPRGNPRTFSTGWCRGRWCHTRGQDSRRQKWNWRENHRGVETVLHRTILSLQSNPTPQPISVEPARLSWSVGRGWCNKVTE